MTLRNLGFLALAILMVVAAINIGSEMRDTTGDDYGRLYGRAIKKTPAVEPLVVTERTVAPVDEARSADPFSLDSAAREQYLGSPTLTPEPVIRSDAGALTPAAPAGGSKVRIEGGPDGVGLVEEAAPRAPQLGGGFGLP